MNERDVDPDALRGDLQAAYAYWCGLSDGGLSCSWQDFDLMALPPRIIPGTVVVDIFPDMDRNVYRFWGSHMTRAFGGDLTGTSPYDLHPRELGAAIRAHHERTLVTKVASATIYGFTGPGGFQLHQTALRMPLSDDSETVHQIVVCVELTEAGLKYLEDA